MNNDSQLITRDWKALPAVVPPTVYTAEFATEPQAGSVLDYWRAICRHKLLLLSVSAVGLLVGVGITLPQAPVYRATTTLEIQNPKDDVLATKILNPGPDTSPADPTTEIQTQIKILQSKTLIERALNRMKANTGVTATQSSDSSMWSRIFVSFAADASHETVVEKTAKNLKISADGQTRIVEVSFDATDPRVAASFANALTSEFIEQSLQARFQMNRRTSEWLGGQLEELRGKLQQSEDALQAYARQKGLLYTGDKQSVSDEKLRQLQTELLKAQADRVEKQSRFELTQTATPETLPDVLNDNSLRTLETSLTDLRRQEADLRITFKPDYAKTKRLAAEIGSLESAIEQKRAAIVKRIDNELQESQRREQMLAAAYAAQTRLVTDNSEKSVQYDILKHEVDSNRQMYETMLQRVKESNIATALKATNVRVIDPAKAPVHPYKPNLPMNAVGGLLCGLMLGIAGVVVRARTDASVQEPGQASALLGIPELGVIPAAESGPKKGAALTLFPQPEKHDGTGLELMRPVYQSPAVADSFRAVLASIMFAGANERPRVLVVTSASPGEGKTTTVTNLAATLANMNQRVLLIDGDIRSPRVHDIFGLDNSVGLTDLLTQRAVDTTLAGASVRKTSIPNLSVLTSGPAVHAGADLLFSRSMPALVTHYREQFDMVLVDTPPMLTMPDARLMGRMADAVVLIARAGRTSRDAIQAAFRRFVEDHTPVLGIVLNDWDAKSSAYKYYASCQEATAAERTLTVVSGEHKA
jgi:succinoglycan biosynthesis transport protein ExoP